MELADRKRPPRLMAEPPRAALVRQAELAAFLDALIPRHRARLDHDAAYEAMMYAAHNPPSRDTLAPLITYLDAARPDARLPRTPLDRDVFHKLAELFAHMVWPDPAPLEAAGRLLSGWNTVALTTLLHSQIPDYPIFGPAEAEGLTRLGYAVRYVDEPTRAEDAYGAMIRAVKEIRENARYDQVPESHHFLTRIVQTALEENGAEA
jgi:hypothetical protein